MKFPQPVKLGEACARWRESDLRRYEAAKAGLDVAAVRVEPEIFLTDKDVAARYQIARPTVWKWANPPAKKSEAA